MNREYEKRLPWKTTEKEFTVSCDSKTCKTKCTRKTEECFIHWDLGSICSNYWNGKNWDKPKQEHRKIPEINTEELFTFTDINEKGK